MASNTPATGAPTVLGAVQPPPDEEIIWEATLTVAKDTFTSFVSFGYRDGGGALNPDTFTYGGQTVTVKELRYGGDPDRGSPTLRFDLDDGGGDWSALEGIAAVNLYLDAQGFRIGNPGGRTDGTRIADHGLEWTKGQKVRVWLTVAETDPPPALSRKVVVGEPMGVDLSTIEEPDGIPNPLEVTYQWTADGADIDGATGPAYRPLREDVGRSVGVTVSFTDLGGADEGPLTGGPAPVTASPLGERHLVHRADRGRGLLRRRHSIRI